MFMSDKKIIAAVEEVIETYSADILNELGLTHNNDGILSRITTTEKVGETVPNGWFGYTERRVGILGLGGCSYEKGSGYIEINVLQSLHYKNKKRQLNRMPFVNLIATFMPNHMKKMYLFILAHELRHYWQMYTGEVYKPGHGRVGGFTLMPYEWRWEEEDANKWAAAYVRKAYKK